MDTGYTAVRQLPPDFKEDYESFLFHSREHLLLQHKEWSHFYLVKKRSKMAIAHIAFHLEKTIAYTPWRSPFGVLSHSTNIPAKLLYDFLEHVEKSLRKKGIKKIILTEPPAFYRTENGLLPVTLFNMGYRVSNAEVGTGVPVDRSVFSEKIDAWEKRKLRQAHEKGLSFQCLPLTGLEGVYHFILKCRNQKGQSLSMTWHELEKTAKVFEKDFLISVVSKERDFAAASIAIRVHQNILYNFYSAHDKKFDAISPVVMLIEGLYDHAREQHLKWLDLGTSAIEGKPNFDLLDFKRRLGGVTSMKLTFEKVLK